ncbi:unnamed protein product [Hanseniaspora opuntiae]
MSASGIIQARDSCVNNSSYDGYLHLRILSIFMILLSSGLGIFLPLILGSNFLTKKVFTSKKEFSFINVFYFICKNFGQGVIFATSFIHLLQPANEELTGECLSPAWQVYPYAFGDAAKNHGHGLFNVGEILEHGHLKEHGILTEGNHDHEKCNTEVKEEDINAMELGLAKNDDDVTSENSSTETIMKGESFTHAHELDTLHKVLSVCILEFGVIFHSVFVGLTLGVVSKDQFKVLFVVLVFHQLFEGLGCGTRIAEVEFSGRIKALFGVMYTLTTPISIAIGLGVRSSLNMDSNGMNIVSGVFDSISAGILMYNGFSLLFSSFNDFPGRIGMKLLAYVTTCFGVGIMALLGKWA